MPGRHALHMVLLLAGGAVPAAAQQARPAAEQTTALADVQRQLASARAENQQLRAALAQSRGDGDALALCKARNGRLVEIGNGLIDSYSKRYGWKNSGPFQFHKVRFDMELQAIGDEIHANKADAAPARPENAQAQAVGAPQN